MALRAGWVMAGWELPGFVHAPSPGSPSPSITDPHRKGAEKNQGSLCCDNCILRGRSRPREAKGLALGPTARSGSSGLKGATEDNKAGR